MKRIVLLYMILLMFITNLNGCSYKKINNESSITNIIGNPSCNIAGGGYVAKQGNWIYYYNAGGYFGIGEGLYKSKIDGSQKEKIASGNISNINVLGDWVYYVLAERMDRLKYKAVIYQYNLYKIRTDGSQKTIVLNDCDNINIVNDSIFYAVNIDDMGYRKSGISDDSLKEENGNIYSMKLDGSQKTKLINKRVRTFFVMGDHIYYDNIGTDNINSIYRTDINGSNPELLVSNKFSYFMISSNKLYYYYRDITNDKNIVNIFDLISRKISSFNIKGEDILFYWFPYRDYIYYITMESRIIYKIKDNGEDEQQLTKDFSRVYGFDGEIYVWNEKKGIRLIDGL